MNAINITGDMKNVIKHVERFIYDEYIYIYIYIYIYERQGKAYRNGIMLKGSSGTGKTTLIEVIATIHKISVYLVNLNCKDMTDEVLIDLIAKIPPRSIIIFEELEKQLKSGLIKYQ